jgi:hypothetical protein
MNLTEINRLCSREGKYENAMISARLWIIQPVVSFFHAQSLRKEER